MNEALKHTSNDQLLKELRARIEAQLISPEQVMREVVPSDYLAGSKSKTDGEKLGDDILANHPVEALHRATKKTLIHNAWRQLEAIFKEFNVVPQDANRMIAEAKILVQSSGTDKELKARLLPILEILDEPETCGICKKTIQANEPRTLHKRTHELRHLNCHIREGTSSSDDNGDGEV